MFYETAQTIGPGWHSRSYKPAHYEEMNWSPSSKHFRSPGSSPETYRRIIHDDDFPRSKTMNNDDEFFTSRRSPTLSRRIFKEVFNDSSPSNHHHHRFSTDRPSMFKRVFRPNRWEDDFDRDVHASRRVERDFDKDFDKEAFRDGTRFGGDLKRDIEDEFEKAAGRVHHIPIMVERRMEEMKSRFGRASSPPPPERTVEDDVEADEWVGPQVQRLRKNFEPENEGGYSRQRAQRSDTNSKPRAFTSPLASETWDPHSVHTLPTRRQHKNSQNFEDCRHTAPPKSVFRSYSETHEDVPKPQPQHSAAFRSHSDGHCPKQTYVTKIEVNLPSDKEREDARPKYNHKEDNQEQRNASSQCDSQATEHNIEDAHTKYKSRNKFGGDSSPALREIAAVLQNVEDLFVRVESYSGTGRDKQFRFLDEMLTRCMLRLDDVDTEGREDVRNSRKAAVRQVQICIEKLEAKADESERRFQKSQAQAEMETESSDVQSNGVESSNVEMKDEVAESDELKLPAVIPLPAAAIPLPPAVIPLPPAVIPLPPARTRKSPPPDTSSDAAPKTEDATTSEETSSNINDDEQTKL